MGRRARSRARGAILPLRPTAPAEPGSPPGIYGPTEGAAAVRDGAEMQVVSDPGGGVRINDANKANFQTLIDTNPASTLFVVEAGITINRTSTLTVGSKNPTIVFLPGSQMVGNSGNIRGIHCGSGQGMTVKGGKFRNFGIIGPPTDPPTNRTSPTPNASGVSHEGFGLVEDVEATLNDIGISVSQGGTSSALTIRRCKVHGNFRYGINAYSPGCNNIVVDSCEFTNNLTGAYDKGYDAGGSKFLTGLSPTGTGSIEIKDCWWHDNLGCGLWMDYWWTNGSPRPKIHNNVFEDNYLWGLHWEVSWSAEIYNNYFENNCYGADVQSGRICSGDGSAGVNLGIEIHHNDFECTHTTSGERRHLLLVSDGRGTPKNTNIHHNRFWMRDNVGGIGGQVGGSGLDTIYSEPSLDFDYNLYKMSELSSSTPRYRWNPGGGAVSWTTWQAAGHDLNGTRELI